MKKLLLVISFFILWATHPKAQSRDPFNAYADLQAPVETFRMTQFGNSSPSLYTGAMAYSVPIFTYSDPEQNKKGKWEYYSINGNNVYVSRDFYGGRLENDIAIAGFDNVISFLQGPFNTTRQKSLTNV